MPQEFKKPQKIQSLYKSLVASLNLTQDNLNLVLQECKSLKMDDDALNTGKLLKKINNAGHDIAAIAPDKFKGESVSKIEERTVEGGLRTLRALMMHLNDKCAKSMEYCQNMNGTNAKLFRNLIGEIDQRSDLFLQLMATMKDLLSENSVSGAGPSLFDEASFRSDISKDYTAGEKKKLIRYYNENVDKISKTRKKNRFFATSSDDVSKAAVDFFSLGHIIMGQVAFWIAYLFLVHMEYGTIWFPVAADAKLACVVLSVAFGIIWEPVENIVLYKMHMKFENKRDSVLNIIFDILFVTLGAGLGYYINNWIVNLVLVIVEFILFLIIRAVVTKK